MKRILSIILIITLICEIPVFSSANTSFLQDPDAIQLAAKSVLMLTCYDNSGNAISTGSGFLAFEDGVIVTNYHVISNASSIIAITEDGQYYDINTILCYDEIKDIAILKTNTKKDSNLLELGSSSALKKGTRVVAIGSPQGFLNTVTEGLYSGEYSLDTEYILFSAAISAGSSGGALFNENGEVIGVTCATWNEAQNLNFAIPIDNVKFLWGVYKTGWYTGNKDIPLKEFYKATEEAKIYSVYDILSQPLIYENEECLIYGYLYIEYNKGKKVLIPGTLHIDDSQPTWDYEETEDQENYFLVGKKDILEENPYKNKGLTSLLESLEYERNNSISLNYYKKIDNYSSGDQVVISGRCKLNYDNSGNYISTSFIVEEIRSY